jgi:hypothetical protein
VATSHTGASDLHRWEYKGAAAARYIEEKYGIVDGDPAVDDSKVYQARRDKRALADVSRVKNPKAGTPGEPEFIYAVITSGKDRRVTEGVDRRVRHNIDQMRGVVIKECRTALLVLDKFGEASSQFIEAKKSARDAHRLARAQNRHITEKGGLRYQTVLSNLERSYYKAVLG